MADGWVGGCSDRVLWGIVMNSTDQASIRILSNQSAVSDHSLMVSINHDGVSAKMTRMGKKEVENLRME